VDPSAWIAPQGPSQPRRRHWGLADWLQQQWWGLDILWTRWWLGFDRDSQASLLRRLLGPLLPWLGAVVLLAMALALSGSLVLLRWLQGRTSGDAGRRQLDRLLHQLALRGVRPEPGDTLERFATRVQQQIPALAPELGQFVATYQAQRFAPAAGTTGGIRELSRRRRAVGRRLGRLPDGTSGQEAR
jgi:hypothetical protein